MTDKRYVFLIPHIIWTIAVAGVTVWVGIGTGDFSDFIKWLVIPFLILLLFPLPTSISAIGMMIITLVKKETEGRKKFIVCGILGVVILLFYSYPFFVGMLCESLGIQRDFWDFINRFTFFSPMLFAVAIWVLWIIHAVKTKKTHKKVLGYKYEKE